MISLMRVTVKTNSMICWLRKLPLTRHLVTSEFHRWTWIKTLIVVISWLREFLKIFIYKILYYILLFTQLTFVMDRFGETQAPFTREQCLMYLLVLLPIVGAVFNNEVFDMEEDTYHAVFTLKMPAREYMLSRFIYSSLKYLTGNLVVGCLVLCLFGGLPFQVAFCYVIYGTALKWIYTGLEVLYRSRHIGERWSNRVISIARAVITGIPIVLVIMLFAGVNYVLPVNYLTFAILAAASLLISIPLGLFLVHYDKYRLIFKTFLTPEMIIKNKEARQNAETQVTRESMSKAISGFGMKTDMVDKRSGYDLFNALFFKRHWKIILMPALTTAGLAVLGVGALIFLIITEPGSTKAVSFALYEYPGFLLFTMYAINTAKRASEAMFVNCDASMLMYRFYRKPKTLLSVFAGRLKRLMFINLIPAVVIAGGVALLVAMSGEGSVIDIILYPLTVIVLSMFFTTHNVILYYLLQPFTSESKIKNPVYKFVHMITYMVCFTVMMYMRNVPTTMFFGICAGFSIVYIPVALIIVYKLAPKTFRIRI